MRIGSFALPNLYMYPGGVNNRLDEIEMHHDIRILSKRRATLNPRNQRDHFMKSPWWTRRHVAVAGCQRCQMAEFIAKIRKAGGIELPPGDEKIWRHRQAVEKKLGCENKNSAELRNFSRNLLIFGMFH